MIYDVLDLLDTSLRDATAGIDAKITAVALAKGVEPVTMEEILTWDHSRLPSEMNLPTCMLVWERSINQLQSVGKRKADHYLSLQFWTDEQDSEEARKHMAIWAGASLSFLEAVTDPASNYVSEINEVSTWAQGWLAAGRLYTWVGVNFKVKERDENPV